MGSEWMEAGVSRRDKLKYWSFIRGWVGGGAGTERFDG
jgi:hypothetical protein